MERTVILFKPDCLQRNLLGEIIHRYERKGLKIVGLKMIKLSDAMLDEHYEHHKGKPFFQGIKDFMMSAPVVAMVLEGNNAVEVVRFVNGETHGQKADAGTVRGDYSMSIQANIVHSSDSVENAQREIQRFFDGSELFDYKKIDFEFIYGADER